MEKHMLVVDAGAGQDAFRMVAMIRQAGVYAELCAVQQLPREIRASGFVVVGNLEQCEQQMQALLGYGLPMLVFGRCSLSLVRALGGKVNDVSITGQVKDLRFSQIGVFSKVEGGMRKIESANYISLPEGCRILAGVESTVLAFDALDGRVTAMQFMPEAQDLDVSQVLLTLLFEQMGFSGDFTMENYEGFAMQTILDAAGDKTALCMLSGGVDSSVAASLAYRALGDRLDCVLIDTGLLREHEAENVIELFSNMMNKRVRRVDATTRTLLALEGLKTADQKRRAVEEVINACIEEELRAYATPPVLVRGIHYEDIYTGHLPPRLETQVQELEPLKPLLKDEVRTLALYLGLPDELAYRRHYPAAGIALRCVGEASGRRVEVLRLADAVLQRIVTESGQLRAKAQCFAVLLDVTEGYETLSPRYVIALRVVHGVEQGRAVVSRISYEVLEAAAQEIMATVPYVYRVVFDLTACPPGRVEWE